MSGQSQIRIKTGNALDRGTTTSNVATNKAELEALAAANVDGKDTYPQSVSTQRLQVAQTLSIGDQVQMTDGCVSAEHLASGSVTTEKLNCTDVTTSNISFSGGSLSEFGVSTLGSITGGSLSVGSGGVTISADGGTSGVYIGGNVISCIYGGSPTFHVDGTTGIVTATKFQMTADGDSSVNLSSGTHIFADAITVGSGGTAATLGTIKTNASTAYTAVSDLADDGKVTPAEKLTAKQAWDAIVNEYSNLVSRANAQDVSYSALTTDYNALNSYLNTTLAVFSNMSASTSVTRSTWDAYWKNYYNEASDLYGALANDAETKADSAETNANGRISATQDYIGFTNGHITSINTGGITISTATSGARTYMDSNGIAAYNSSGTKTVQLDSTNGLWVNNASSSAGVPERLSVAYNGTEHGRIWCDSNNKLRIQNSGDMLLEVNSGYNTYITEGSLYLLDLSSSLVVPSIVLGYYNDSPPSYCYMAHGSSPSQGASASGYPLGSIYAADGGSLWIVNGAGQWDRVRTYSYNP